MLSTYNILLLLQLYTVTGILDNLKIRKGTLFYFTFIYFFADALYFFVYIKVPDLYHIMPEECSLMFLISQVFWQ